MTTSETREKINNLTLAVIAWILAIVCAILSTSPDAAEEVINMFAFVSAALIISGTILFVHR